MNSIIDKFCSVHVNGRDIPFEDWFSGARNSKDIGFNPNSCIVSVKNLKYLNNVETCGDFGTMADLSQIHAHSSHLLDDNTVVFYPFYLLKLETFQPKGPIFGE